MKSVEADWNGEQLATITLTKRSDSVVIRDEAAFAAWAESVSPNSTQVMVRPENRPFLLDRLKAEAGIVVDSDTGDIVDFAMSRPGAQFPTVRLKDHGDPIRKAIASGFNPMLALEEGE